MSEDTEKSKNDATKFLWQRELEQLRHEAREKGHFRETLHYPDGKIPLSAALEYIDEYLARPEIMTALSNVGIRKEMRDDDVELWGEFTTFLRLRQPTSPDRSPYLSIKIRRLACGEYSDSSDPKLIHAILVNSTFFYDDRDV